MGWPEILRERTAAEWEAIEQDMLGRRLRKGQAGWFYIIQLVPDLKPERLKFGFSRHLQDRLWAYRNGAPTARLIRSYPCVSDDEAPTIAALTATQACVGIAREAFDVKDVERLLAEADRAFAWAADLRPPLYAALLRTAARDLLPEYLMALRDPAEMAYVTASVIHDGHHRVPGDGGPVERLERLARSLRLVIPPGADEAAA